MTIARITGLDVSYRDKEGWHHVGASQTPPGMMDALDPVGIGERFARGDAGTTIVDDDYGFSWLAGTGGGVSLVVGPFITGTLSSRGAQFLRRFSGPPPSRNPEEIEGIADMLTLVNGGGGESGAADRTSPEPATAKHADISGIHNPAVDQDHQENSGAIDSRYEYEHRIRDAVSRGDRNALSRAIGDGFPTKDFYHRLPGNPLRIEKNLTVVLNTMLRLSAEQGGLMPVVIHGISEEFAVRIEQARRVEDMEPLRTEMMYRYCEAVHRFTLAHHTMPVRAVTGHILTNLGADHTLSELAEIAGCSPSYLSRLFRRELGVTIGEFVTEKRIGEARWLLAQSDQPMAEIADTLGFSSLNYFRRVFKKETGTTPGAYRRRYRHLQGSGGEA